MAQTVGRDTTMLHRSSGEPGLQLRAAAATVAASAATTELKLAAAALAARAPQLEGAAAPLPHVDGALEALAGVAGRRAAGARVPVHLVDLPQAHVEGAVVVVVHRLLVACKCGRGTQRKGRGGQASIEKVRRHQRVGDLDGTTAGRQHMDGVSRQRS